MPRSYRWLFLSGLILFICALPAMAVKPPDPRPVHLPPPRHSLTTNAGYVFSGTVKAVDRLAPRNGGVAVMQITFHVDQGFRGVRSGQTLVIREWAGLWQGQDRYRPGERVMLFLYPPSKLGLTSPVGGAAGRFNLDPAGRVIIEPRRVEIRGRIRVPANLRLQPGALLQALRAAEEERP